jgi:hypothetical protein
MNGRDHHQLDLLLAAARGTAKMTDAIGAGEA